MNYSVTWTSTYTTGYSSCLSFNSVNSGSDIYGSIINGNGNCLYSAGKSFSTIANGVANMICGGSAFIGTGKSNCILVGADNSVIGNGYCNHIGDRAATPTHTSPQSFIGSGYRNCIDATGGNSGYNFIGTGTCNLISAGTYHASIVGNTCGYNPVCAPPTQFSQTCATCAGNTCGYNPVCARPTLACP